MCIFTENYLFSESLKCAMRGQIQSICEHVSVPMIHIFKFIQKTSNKGRNSWKCMLHYRKVNFGYTSELIECKKQICVQSRKENSSPASLHWRHAFCIRISLPPTQHLVAAIYNESSIHCCLRTQDVSNLICSFLNFIFASYFNAHHFSSGGHCSN